MATSANAAAATEIPSSCSDASRPGKLVVWIDFSLMNACANRRYSRFPPSLHALKVLWDKNEIAWFFGEGGGGGVGGGANK